MTDKESKETKFKVSYTKSPDYRKLPVNGAVGGVTPHGDILCHFYLESNIVPDEAEITLNGIKKIDEKQKRHSEFRFVRDLQVGIMLSPYAAKSIGEFLIKNADQVLSFQGAQPEDGEDENE